MRAMQKMSGFTLVELMIAVTIASIISVGVLSTFTSQSALFLEQNRNTKSTQEVRDAYDMVVRLLVHAEMESVTIKKTEYSLTVDFNIPEGYPVWPNTQGPHFSDNAIRVKWEAFVPNEEEEEEDDSKYPNQISIAKADNLSALSDDLLVPIVGGTSSASTRISNLVVNKVSASEGFRVEVAGAVGTGDSLYGITFNGMVLPRN